MDFWLNIVIVICFAACSGFRAFLPLLIIAILGKLEYLHLKDSFSWLISDFSIMILGVAAVVEVLGDKFPLIDNFLDVLVIFIKPLCAILIVLSIIDIKNSLILYIISIIISSTVTLPLHLVKAKTRLLASSNNFFSSSTFISIIEDIFVIIMTILTVFIPLVVFILIGIMLLFIYNRIKKNQFLKTV